MNSSHINILSTRLFPKNNGANNYIVNGIARRCDWVLLSDIKEPKVKLVYMKQVRQPRHIFISLREPYEAIDFFVKKIIPRLTEPFVLVSGSEDVTIPHQTDVRWRRFNEREREMIQSICDHPLLIRWFVENMDDDSHPLMSPLPIGMVFRNPAQPADVKIPDVTKVSDRPMRVLCAHRIREGEQWSTRQRVNQLATEHWSQWCTVLTNEIPEEKYVDLLEQHAFVLCAKGGGLDPSPRAWQAILHGTIPIIESTALDAAYREVPVAFVGSWNPKSITESRLKKWLAVLGPMYDLPEQREEVLDRLGLDYWWAKISQCYRDEN